MKEVKIVNKRVRESFAGPGMTQTNAEIQLEVAENGQTETLFVHVNSCVGYNYTLAKTSFYDNITGLSDEDPGEIDYIESFESMDERFELTDEEEEQCIYEDEEEKQWDAVMKSEYAEYYQMAKEMIDNYEEE